MALQGTSSSAYGSSSADSCNEYADLPVGVLPYLLPRGPFMNCRIGRIDELPENDGSGSKIHSETQAADLKAMEDLAKAGMEVYQVPASEVALWQEATKQVREDFIKNNPKLGKTLVDQCLAANK